MLSLIHAVSGRPWAVRADVAAQVQGLLMRSGFAGLRHLAELKAVGHAHDGVLAGARHVAVEAAAGSEPQAARGKGSTGGPAATVAVIPIIGTLTQRGDYINSAYTRSTADIAAEIGAAAADGKVDAIVLDVDSPGGEVYGVPEAWAAIREAAKSKPVIAVANAQAASAALYLASAATELWVTPSGEAGSVGVYALHVDASKAIAEAGEQWEFIVADDSPFKVEGNPTEPLSDDARTQIKKAVNRYMGMFVRDLALGRGVSRDHVRESFGGGRMLGPQEAVAARMADQVGTLEQAIRRAVALGGERRADRVSGGRPANPAGMDARLMGTL